MADTLTNADPAMEAVGGPEGATTTPTHDEFWDDLDLSDTPAAPEAPTDPSPGQPRGPDGKFLPKANDTEGSPTAPAAPSHIPTPEQPQATEPTPQLPPLPVKYESFLYRAVHQNHELPDVKVLATGDVLWPAAKVGDLKAALNAKHLAEGEFQPLIQRQAQEIAQLRTQAESKTLAETKHEQALEALHQALNDPDEDRFIERMYALRGDMPNLLAQAEAKYWREQAERGARPETVTRVAPVPQNPTLPSPDEAYAATAETVEQFKTEFRDLAPEDWQQLDAAIRRTPLAFLRPATVEDAQHHDVTPGELVLDTDAIREHVVATAEQARRAREAVQRTAHLAADTARRTTTQVQTPPSAGGAKAPPKGERRIQSKQDMEDYWDSDEA